MTALPNDLPGGWAEVRAHGRVIRYRCSGSGRAVLLLPGECDAGEAWAGLARALAARFRVIVPDAPPPEADVTGWLSAFLEGIGARSVGVVAGGRRCLPALEVALAAAGQVASLVLVPDGPGPAGGWDGALETGTPVARVPLLVVRGDPPPDIAPLVGAFLDGAWVGA